jgi:hypothetical protein
MGNFAEAWMKISINTIPSKETLVHFLQDEQDNINEDIGAVIVSLLRTWLRSSSVQKQKVDLKFRKQDQSQVSGRLLYSLPSEILMDLATENKTSILPTRSAN